MIEYNFDEEMDLLAEKIPGFYDDVAARHIALPYRIEWIGIKTRAIEEVFGTSDIPKIATEDHIRILKETLRRIIEAYPDLNPKDEI